VAVDRPLDDRQLRDLRALSTRAQITSTSFVNEYHWGDFRGDPQALMDRYFDAFLYLANWGTHRLMFRLPARVLDLETARRYCDADYVSARQAGDHVIIDLQSEDEDGGDVETGDGWLTSIVPARAELATGDLRALYLAWLLSAQSGELDDDEVEPPVPAGLRSLSASLSSLADFLRIDPDLLEVAATASKPLRVADLSDAVVARWVDRLPEREKNDLLARVIQGDGGGVRTELLRGLHGPAGTHAGHRTVGELLSAAETHRMAREREAERRRSEERARRELEAATAREKRLETVARQEERAWQRVSELIDTKKQSEYDTAVAVLEDLAAGDPPHRAAEFERRIQDLRLTHRRKPSLMDRLDRAGLGVVGSPHGAIGG
jgi:hypothetical protein